MLLLSKFSKTWQVLLGSLYFVGRWNMQADSCHTKRCLCNFPMPSFKAGVTLSHAYMLAKQLTQIREEG